MITECSCLQSQIMFRAARKLSPRPWNKNRYDYGWPTYSQVITIHGETLQEIDEKKEAILKELRVKYPEPDYQVYQRAWYSV